MSELFGITDEHNNLLAVYTNYAAAETDRQHLIHERLAADSSRSRDWFEDSIEVVPVVAHEDPQWVERSSRTHSTAQRSRSVDAVLRGEGSYDDLDEEQQAEVRAEWDRRIKANLGQTDLELEFKAQGRTVWAVTDDDGKCVVRVVSDDGEVHDVTGTELDHPRQQSDGTGC